MNVCGEHGTNSNVCEDEGCFGPKATMRFKLEIDCKGAAFGEMPELHLCDLLRGIANTLQYVHAIDRDRPIRTPIHDVNGNRCGTWELSSK